MTVHVLILCTHNSARSVLGEGMLNHLAARLGRDVQAHSAGSAPSGRINPFAIEALANAGVDTRTVWTGNATRQPAFRDIPCRRDPAGYPNADQVMRGGTLIGCHHGLTDEMVGIMHRTFREFVSSRGL